MYNITKRILSFFLFILISFSAYTYSITVTVTIHYDDPDTHYDPDGNDITDDINDNYGGNVEDYEDANETDVTTDDNRGSYEEEITIEIPDAVTPPGVIDEIVDDDNIETLNETIETADGTPGIIDENNDDAADTTTLDGITGSAENQETGEAEISNLEENTEGSPTSGDPVILSIGQFTTNSTDLFLSNFSRDIEFVRTYRSNNESAHSMGKGWAFSYDTRIIRGVKIDAWPIQEQAEIETQEARDFYNSSKMIYKSALGELNELVGTQDEAGYESILAGLGTSLEALYGYLEMEPGDVVGSLIQDKIDLEITEVELLDALNLPAAQNYPEVRARINQDLAKVRDALNNVILPKIDDAAATKTKLIEEWPLILEAEAIMVEREAEADLMEKEAVFSDTSEERNRYVFNDTDSSWLQMTGNMTLTLVDETGYPHIYRLREDDTPDYDSQVYYPDGSINYYPDGVTAESVLPDNEKLIMNSDGTYTLIYRDQTEVGYDFYGQLTYMEDPNGNRIVFEYLDHRLVKIVDPVGRETTIGRSGEIISGISDYEGRTVSFQYSGDLLTGVTDVDGDTVTYDYKNGLIHKIIKPDSSMRIYNFIYNDEAGRYVLDNNLDEENAGLFDSSNPGMRDMYGNTMPGVEYFEYDFASRTTTYTDPSGVVSIHEHNEELRESEVIYSDGTSTQSGYDENNYLSSFSDRLGNTTAFVNDESGNRTSTHYEGGDHESSIYNDKNDPEIYTDATGNIFTYSYDLRGNLERIDIDPSVSGAQSSYQGFSYFDNGQIKTVSRGPTEGLVDIVIEYSYDENGNIDYYLDGEEKRWEVEYDILGRVISSTPPGSADTTFYEYTPGGRISAERYPDGLVREYVYTNRKDLDYIQISHSEDEFEAYTIDYQYNKRHNLLSVSAPGRTETYDYSAGGKLTRKTVTDGDETTILEYEYTNPAGELSEMKRYLGDVSAYDGPELAGWRQEIPHAGTDTDWSVEQYEYEGGVLRKKIDPLRSVTEYGYDGRNRVSRVTQWGDYSGTPLTTDFVYDGLSRLEMVTNPKGNYTEYTYNQFGGILTVSRNGLLTDGYTYDGLARMTTGTDGEGKTTEYTYDRNGKVIKVLHPDGETTELFDYNDKGELTSYEDKNGETITFAYDQMGRMLLKNYPSSLGDMSETWTYDGLGYVDIYNDIRDEIWDYDYDTLGQVTRMTDPYDFVTEYTYNQLGRRGRTVRQLNEEDGEVKFLTTSHEYDPAGRLLTETNPLGETRKFFYDGADNLLRTEDPVGRWINYSYDPFGRMTGMERPENVGVAYTYDANGNRVSETLNNGTAYRYEYDERDRLVKEINRLNEDKRYTYYNNNLLKRVEDFTNQSISYDYTPMGRVDRVNYPDFGTKDFTYDGNGNLTGAKDSSSDLNYRYDALDRLTRAEDILKEQVINYEYLPDWSGMTKSWAGDGRNIEYIYGRLGEVLSVTDPEGLTTTFEYDDLLREIERLQPNDVKRLTTYDDAGRIKSITHTTELPGNSKFLDSFAYVYHAAGQRTFQMDERGRITAYEYDEASRIQNVYYPMAGKKSIIDFRERIYLGIIPEELENTSYPDRELTPESLEDELNLLLGESPELEELGFNVESYLEDLTTTVNGFGEIFADLTTGFDWNVTRPGKGNRDRSFKMNWGHLKKELPPEVSIWLKPDVINRMMRQPQWQESFAYDGSGNISSKTNGWGEISYQYDEENRLTSAGERVYTYDVNGNLTGESIDNMTAAYGYTYDNRVNEITTNTSGFVGTEEWNLEVGVRYQYDALGRRISREQISMLSNSGVFEDRMGATTDRIDYLYDGLGFEVLAEGRGKERSGTRGGWHYTGMNSFHADSEYVYAGGRPVSRTDLVNDTYSFENYLYGNQIKKEHYAADPLGSVMLLTDERGHRKQRYEYDAYGRKIEGHFERVNDLGYNGKKLDPVTGWYNYGYRDYSPMQMRFTTVDPIRDGLNWYVYVGNDPLNFVDPFGLSAASPEDDGAAEENWLMAAAVIAMAIPEPVTSAAGALVAGILVGAAIYEATSDEGEEVMPDPEELEEKTKEQETEVENTIPTTEVPQGLPEDSKPEVKTTPLIKAIKIIGKIIELLDNIGGN